MRNGKHVALSTLKEKCLVNSAFWQFTDLYFRIRHTVFTYRDSNISSAEGVSPFFCTSCGWKICACLKIYGNCKHVTILPQPHVIEMFLSKTFWLYTKFDSNHLRFQNPSDVKILGKKFTGKKCGCVPGLQNGIPQTAVVLSNLNDANLIWSGLLILNRMKSTLNQIESAV